jgi:hypothetical protein
MILKISVFRQKTKSLFMNIKAKNRIPFSAQFLFIVIVFTCVFPPSLSAQNNVKAEIKKPQFSLNGEWAAAIGKQEETKTISSEYVYDFLPNGKYKYLGVLLIKNDTISNNIAATYYIIETGKWRLINNDKTLMLVSDSLSNKRVKPFDLADSQEFIQTKSTSFVIKRKNGDEIKAYVYLRRNHNFRRARFY